MPLDPDFVADAPYGPGGLLMDAVLEVDREASRIRVRMPTHAELPLTREQRADPLRHPRHVSGGLMVHMTGMVAFAHFYYISGLRHGDGWIGYGGRIHSARFRALAPPGEPMELECRGISERRGEDKLLARYEFRFSQADTLVYTGDQTAMWIRVGEAPGAG